MADEFGASALPSLLHLLALETRFYSALRDQDRSQSEEASICNPPITCLHCGKPGAWSHGSVR